MPDKLHRCVKAVMESGKTEESAWAICQAQFKDSYRGKFQDVAIYDPQHKTALSVRDGVLEYYGSEIGMEPADQLFRVFRSPATIANAAMKMQGLPITDGHVDLDLAPPAGGGFVSDARMVDAADPATDTTIAILNRLTLGDTLATSVETGKRELSLGYSADLVPHPSYDFEQLEITPHHLAVVERGRCGPMCSFIDRKPTKEDKTMPGKLHKAFTDQEGAMNMQQIVELVAALPEAIKAVPVDQLTELLPALQQLVEAAKGVMPATEMEEPATEEEMTDEEKAATEEEQKKQFGDAVAKQAAKLTDAAIQVHTEVMEKARLFLDEGYNFRGKTTNQIMRDTLATRSTDKFTDAELPVAFKVLQRPAADYTKFGDASPGDFASVGDKEL